ncbi:uncharacterized protein LOC111311269 isoform X2 [Durio zibethinus]|uniref:Uncharacterized protein LOC111311269 isoform X2 n=1 Tax=Durio zibethinus TaxID=66656 RepID=A0A6P6ANJ4_DURZI|nr:uncharacterized protein LOC111311269 isoform X2 [Durio zibethinus]
MLLGKRPRPPMKRTTSMTKITFDLNTTNDEAPPSDPHNPFNDYPTQAAAGLFGGVWGQQVQANGGGVAAAVSGGGVGSGLEELDQRLLATVSPRVNRRGDSAFCSLECRQQQMNQDEKKEKCSIASKKQAAAASSAARSGVSTKGETVAAI